MGRAALSSVAIGPLMQQAAKVVTNVTYDITPRGALSDYASFPKKEPENNHGLAIPPALSWMRFSKDSSEKGQYGGFECYPTLFIERR
jgi:hypothetical protein